MSTESFPGYEVISELGRGGMGVVWLARQVALDRLVAIKQVLPGTTDPIDLARFRREGALLRDMVHPGLVRLLDYELDAPTPYLVLEYVEGARSLIDLIAREPPMHTRALALAQGIAEALGHVHERGVIHRDLKPGNVLLGPDGRPRLIDLGLARSLNAAEAERLTNHGEVMGTMVYMAPEQLTGMPTDARADVYALGLVLYELLARRFVFASNLPDAVVPLRRLTDRWSPVTDYAPTVHPSAAALVARCLAVDPAARPPDGRAVAEALGEILDPTPRARPPRRTAPVPALVDHDAPTRPRAADRGPRRRRISRGQRAAAAVALAGVSLALFTAMLFLWGPGVFLPGGSSRIWPSGPPPAARAEPVSGVRALADRLAARLAAAHARLDERALAAFAEAHRGELRRAATVGERDLTRRVTLETAVRDHLRDCEVEAALSAFLTGGQAWFDDARAPEAARWSLRTALGDLELWELFCREQGVAWPLPSVRVPGGAWDTPVAPEAIDFTASETSMRRESHYESRFAELEPERTFTLPADAARRRALLWFGTSAWRGGLVVEVTVNRRFRRLLAADPARLSGPEPPRITIRTREYVDGGGTRANARVSVLGDPDWSGRRGYLGMWLPVGLLEASSTLRCRVVSLPGAASGLDDAALRERIFSLFENGTTTKP